MNLFFRLLDIGVPLTVVVVTFLLTSFTHILIYIKFKRHTLSPWIAATLFLMIYSTVIGRMIRGVSVDTDLQLMPFWSIEAIHNGHIATLYEKIYNVIFFVPYGALLGIRTIAISNRKSHTPTRVNSSNDLRLSRPFTGCKGAIIIGCLTSIAIELIQLVTQTGTCETDDVICNTLGCTIGIYLIVILLQSLRKAASIRPA